MAKNDVGTIVGEIYSNKLEPFVIGFGKALRGHVSRDINSLDDFLRVFMEGSTSFSQNSFFAFTRLNTGGAVSFSYKNLPHGSNLTQVRGSMFDNGADIKNAAFNKVYQDIESYFSSNGKITSQYILQEPSQRL